MSDWALRCVFLCLAVGAVLGGLFLIFKLLRILLGLGKVGTAVLDMIFCAVCSAVVFLERRRESERQLTGPFSF